METEIGEGERVGCTRISLTNMQIHNKSALITKGCLSKMDANPRETKLKVGLSSKLCLRGKGGVQGPYIGLHGQQGEKVHNWIT